MLAAHSNRLEALQFLVKSCQIDVNHQSKDGFTPLWLASEHGHFQIVKYLIEECEANPYLLPKVSFSLSLSFSIVVSYFLLD
jgi:ankyrin repeat protein